MKSLCANQLLRIASMNLALTPPEITKKDNQYNLIGTIFSTNFAPLIKKLTEGEE